MARRKSQLIGFQDTLFIIGGAVFGLVALLKFLFSIAGYFIPPLLCFLAYLAFRRAGDFTKGELQEQLVGSLALRSNSEYGLNLVLTAGEEEEIQFLDDEFRFEKRSRRGQELNRQLAHWQNEIDESQASIDSEEGSLQQLATRRAAQVSLTISIAAFALVLLAVEAGLIKTAMATPSSGGVVAWVARPSVMIASSATIIGGLLFFSIARKVIFWFWKVNDDDPRVAEQLAAVGIGTGDDDDAFDEDDEDNEDEDDEESPHWTEVLGVDADAEPGEINKAYREAIKKCHPDTVADRSETIKEAAKYESQMVNAAYRQARAEREF